MLSDVEAELEQELTLARAQLIRERRARELRLEVGRLAARTSAMVSRREVAEVIVGGTADLFGAGWAMMAYVAEERVVQFVHGPGVPQATRDDWSEAPLDTPIPMCDVLRGDLGSVTLRRPDEFSEWPLLAAEADGAAMGSLVVRRIGGGKLPSAVLAVAWPNAHELDDVEAELLKLLIDEAGAGFVRSERTEVDGEVAHALQQRVLDLSPQSTDRLDIATLYEPGRDFLAVGGDWFDVIRLDPGRTAIVVGDVVGHDVRAALEMAQVRHVVATHLVAFGDPVVCLRMSDQYLCQRAPEIMATALIAIIGADDTVTLTSAGHLPPIVIAERVVRIQAVGLGPPLGTGLGDYASETFTATPGEMLLLYTDGIVETRDEPIDKNLANLVEALSNIVSEQVAPEVITAEDIATFLRRRVDVARRTDDAASVVVRFLG